MEAIQEVWTGLVGGLLQENDEVNFRNFIPEDEEDKDVIRANEEYFIQYGGQGDYLATKFQCAKYHFINHQHQDPDP